MDVQNLQSLQQSWDRAWAALGARPEAGLFERLLACYSEPHRRYHTLEHLTECLERLDAVLARADHPGELEVALWFHDAVYAVKRHDNELQSANWAEAACRAGGVSEEAATRVFALVMATRHSALAATSDERLLVDVDLSILGASAARFDEYERQVQDEYAWVPRWLFRRKRKAVLREFLDRPAIFSTDHFRGQLEARARENLQRSVATLCARREVVDPYQ